MKIALGSVVMLSGVLLSACDVDVHNKGTDKNVDVRTALGDISVHTNDGGAQTGLPVYPGAQPLRDDDKEASGANISASSALFGLHLAAAKFQSNDAPAAILAFYREKMSTYGSVIECNGDIDFDQSKQPVCRQDSSGETQLVAGTEPSHRLVSVKPRGSGSEFALVSIQFEEKERS